MTRELSVVIPTFNERDNVEPLLARLAEVLADRSWEAIVVDDDSPDGTADRVRAIAARDERVRCIQRIGRRGLASACIEGMLASSAPYLAVIDADLQHDETLLPKMLDAIRAGDLDLVVGSRYVAGGSLGALTGVRGLLSRLGTLLARAVTGADLADPLSGFFVVRRAAFDQAVRRMSGTGFKILLDLLASAPRPLRLVEIAYTFRPRHAGQSKLDALVASEYLLLLGEKLAGGRIPVRLVGIAVVGGLGILVHLAFLAVWFAGLGIAFGPAQIAALVVAMAFHFSLDNAFSYRDQRLRGIGLLKGLLRFLVAGAPGALINLVVAVTFFDSGAPWWLAGVVGALVGALWNHAIAASLTGTARTPRR